MYLNKEDCQKIVNRVMNILGKNINIMDEKGVIVASGDKTRVNTYHRAAEIAVLEKREIYINKENINMYEGCKQGVNIPIYYGEKVLGVVGITGEYKEVKGYGAIVKEFVELLIQENERRKIEMLQGRAKRSFAKELIKNNKEEDLNALGRRAKLVDFDLSVSRVVIIADICNFTSITNNFKKEKLELYIQEIKEEIIYNIEKTCDQRYDLAFNLSNDRFIIFKRIKKDIKDYCKELQRLLDSKMNMTLNFSIGYQCNNIEDYHKSYDLALRLLKIGRRFNPNEHIYCEEKYRLQLLLDNMGHKAIEQYQNSFKDLYKNSKNGDLLETVKVYFENNMSVKETAERMFVHRNTILYRINKLNELYDIDIKDSYICMLVYLGITMDETN